MAIRPAGIKTPANRAVQMTAWLRLHLNAMYMPSRVVKISPQPSPVQLGTCLSHAELRVLAGAVVRSEPGAVITYKLTTGPV